jgi:hypothetical protein
MRFGYHLTLEPHPGPLLRGEGNKRNKESYDKTKKYRQKKKENAGCGCYFQ